MPKLIQTPLAPLRDLPAWAGMAILGLLLIAGCMHVTVDPIEVKPITLNVNLKVDRQLDDFFAFEKDLSPSTASATQPSTRPAAQQ